MNPLEAFFNSRRPTDRGIWKWLHYFDVYHRHLARFRGPAPINMLEIGVYGGGSLEMWAQYLDDPVARGLIGVEHGPPTIHGVDIDPACKGFERGGVKIHIGDQASSAFWSTFRSEVKPLDIVIDDGGHREDQQLAAWRNLWMHMNPGGVYIVEDVEPNRFLNEVMLMATMLQPSEPFSRNMDDDERSLIIPASHFQQQVESIHVYTGMVVLEKPAKIPTEFVASRKGLLP